ncbi:MAG: hypothetical protein ABIG37_03715 [Nanoarchaeota archaeon]|nr:hypothetical protein [Nanoarchaeota archaeon]
MQKPEIVEGLKYAIEKGESIEKAKQSFINAGYELSDVEDSANVLGGVITKIHPEESPAPINEEDRKIPVNPMPKEKGTKSRKILIALIIVLLILISFFLVSFFFKDKIINFISGFF